jgi:hypothetical protein
MLAWNWGGNMENQQTKSALEFHQRSILRYSGDVFLSAQTCGARSPRETGKTVGVHHVCCGRLTLAVEYHNRPHPSSDLLEYGHLFLLELRAQWMFGVLS